LLIKSQSSFYAHRLNYEDKETFCPGNAIILLPSFAASSNKLAEIILLAAIAASSLLCSSTVLVETPRHPIFFPRYCSIYKAIRFIALSCCCGKNTQTQTAVRDRSEAERE
jgi:hypothetical protein